MTTLLEINRLFDQAVEEYRATQARKSPSAGTRSYTTPESVVGTVFMMLATLGRDDTVDPGTAPSVLKALGLSASTHGAILALDHASEEFQAFAHQLFHPRN